MVEIVTVDIQEACRSYIYFHDNKVKLQLDVALMYYPLSKRDNIDSVLLLKLQLDLEHICMHD